MFTTKEKTLIQIAAIKLQVPLSLLGIFHATAKRIFVIKKIANEKITPIKASRIAFGELMQWQIFKN